MQIDATFKKALIIIEVYYDLMMRTQDILRQMSDDDKTEAIRQLEADIEKAMPKEQYADQPPSQSPITIMPVENKVQAEPLIINPNR